MSAAAAYQATEQVALVSDIGVAQNTDRSDRTKPAYFLVGAIYSPTSDLDLDLGWKRGLNHAEADRQVGVGLTFRF